MQSVPSTSESLPLERTRGLWANPLDRIMSTRRRSKRQRRRIRQAAAMAVLVIAGGGLWIKTSSEVKVSARQSAAADPVPALAPPPPAAPVAVAEATPVEDPPVAPIIQAQTESEPLAEIAPAGGEDRVAVEAESSPEIDSPVKISEMQRLLARLDLRPGPPDGVLGHRTVQAIRVYQQFAGLKIDGKPTVALLDDLRAVAAKLPEPTR